MGKKKGKPVLMPPINIDWPKVEKDTEDQIITALIHKLRDFPKLEGKRGEREDEQRRARLRGQVVLGHRAVSKALGWGQLALVLVAGDVQPAILRRSLLPLAASLGCPALCLSSLQPALSPVLGLTSVLAMGFKKPLQGEGVFDDFVNMAAVLAPSIPLPGMKTTQSQSKPANQPHTDRGKDKGNDGGKKTDKGNDGSNTTDRDKDGDEKKDSTAKEEDVDRGDKGKDVSNSDCGTDRRGEDSQGQRSIRETDSCVEGERDSNRLTASTSANAESTAVPGNCDKQGVVGKVSSSSSSSSLLSSSLLSSSSSVKGQETKVALESGDCTKLSSSSSAGAGDASSVSSDHHHWRLMDKEQEQKMLDTLLQVLEPYTKVFQTPRSQMTDEQKQTRKLLNSCLVVDPGALKHSALSGDLDLLLVNCDPDLNPGPDLGPKPHPSLPPLLPVAAEAGCCVLHLTSLIDRMGALVRDRNLRGLGFKKRKAGSSGQQLEDLRRFVSQYNPRADTTTTTTTATATTSKTSNNNNNAPVSKTAQKRRPQTAQVLDVSSLYVYKKKDPASAEPQAVKEAEETTPAPSEKKAAATTASESFISLSSSFYSEPTVMYLGGSNLSEGEGGATCGMAVVDTAGSGKSKSKRDAGVTLGKNDNGVGGSSGGGGGGDADMPVAGGFSGVMGMEEEGSAPLPRPPPVSVDHEARGRKVKAGLKRALEQSAERGEFVSFSLTPTTILTSLPNPSKKRKNKKNKFKK